MKEICSLLPLRIVSFLLIPFLLATAGCSGTFKTHVRPEGDFSPVAKVADCKAEYSYGVCQQIEHANQWIKAYQQAGANPSNFRSGIAAATLPLAGLATFYGVTGHGSADRIARLSIGSATAYGYGTFFGAKGKQAVYFEGARAMTCVQLAAGSALVRNADIVTIEEQLIILEGELAKIAEYSTLDAQQTTSVASAKSVAAAARDLLGFVKAAPLMLHGRIMDISIAVDKLLLENEPTLESLASLTGNLKGLSQSFGGGTTPPVAKAPAAEGEGAPHAMLPIESALAAMANAAEKIRARLVAYQDVRRNFAATDACSPKADAGTFSVTPANAALSIVEGASSELAVADSSGFPSVSVTGANSNAVELSAFEVKGNALVLKITGKKATGAEGPTITIRSASGIRVHAAQVLVSAPPKDPGATTSTPSAQSGTNTAATPRNVLEKDLFKDPANILRVQCAVGLKGAETDCKMGDITRTAIAKNRGNDGTVDRTLKDISDTQEVHKGCDTKNPTCVSENTTPTP